MKKVKASAITEEEYSAERLLAEEAAAAGKAMDGIVWQHEEGLIVVRSKYPSNDNKFKTGIAFRFIEKGDAFEVVRKEPGVEVMLEPIPLTQYHQLLKDESVHWLKEQLVLAGELEPLGDNTLALAGYLTRLRQLPPGRSKEVTTEAREDLMVNKERLTLRLKWSQRLAQIPGLTNDEYLVLACEKLPPSRQALRLTKQLQARGESMSANDPAVAAELEEKQQAAAKEKDKKPTAAKKPAASKKDTTKETGTMPQTATATKAAPKSNSKAKGKAVKAPKAAKPKRDKSSLIQLKKHFKQGMKVKYVGKNKEFFNKTVEVLYPEKDPNVGVMIKFPGDKRQSVSPTSLSK